MSSSNSSGGDGQYIEHEVRTVYTESRKYYVGMFPQAPKQSENEEMKLYPPLGTSEFPAPVRLKQREVVQEVSEDENSEEEEGGFRRFKKRRMYNSRKDTEWVLTDKKRKREFRGQVDGQSARYFMLIPPGPNGSDSSFRVVPIHEWIQFKKPPSFKPLSASEAKKLREEKSTTSKIEKYMAKRRQKLEEEFESSGIEAKRKERKILSEGEIDLENPEDLLQSDDDKETKAKARASNPATLEEDEDEAEGDEEDIEVLAIDRKGGTRGEGNGDADFEEQFDDDDDDAEVFDEEEQAKNDGEDLIQGAEEVREALSEDEEEEEEEEDDEDEEEEEGGDAQYNAAANKLETEVSVVMEVEGTGGDGQAKVGEGVTSAAEQGETAAATPPRKSAVQTSYEQLRERVLDLVRQSGGSMDVAKLYKAATKKKFYKSLNLSSDYVKENLVRIVREVFDIREDNITGKKEAFIKQQFV